MTAGYSTSYVWKLIFAGKLDKSRSMRMQTPKDAAELELLEKAILVAVNAHRGQKDRCGAPYILHPLRVMSRVRTPSEKTVAILHDVVEDTDWTFEKLRREGFPPAVIQALRCVTKREGENYEDFVKRSASNPLACRVKLADLEDNMDVRRLPQVTGDATKRFQQYLRAWHFLTQRQNKSRN